MNPRDRVARAVGFSAAVLLFGGAPVAAQTGTFTVRGTVVERGQTRGIAQAMVLLGEDRRAITSDRGEFEFRAVRPGRYPVVVEALGYRTLRTSVLVLNDVSGTLELAPEPVPLPEIEVRPVTFVLRGRVTDKETGRSVPYVTVRIPEVGETSTNDAGGFRLGNLSGGRRTLLLEGFGWLPVQFELDLSADTTVALQMERDPIMERIIVQQIEQLSVRIRGVGQSLRTVDRTAIRRSRAATPVDILSGEGVRVADCPGTHRRACVDLGYAGIIEPYVFIDDRLTQCGLEVLSMYPNAMIERLEVVGHGTYIRAYTTWFIERMAAGRVRLEPLVPWLSRFTC